MMTYIITTSTASHPNRHLWPLFNLPTRVLAKIFISPTQLYNCNSSSHFHFHFHMKLFAQCPHTIFLFLQTTQQCTVLYFNAMTRVYIYYTHTHTHTHTTPPHLTTPTPVVLSTPPSQDDESRPAWDIHHQLYNGMFLK